VIDCPFLERELHRKLNQSWVSGCGNATEVRTTNTSVRVTEVRMVEDVEELRSEFNDLAFADLRALHHREVEEDVARSMEHVTAKTTESSAAGGERRSGTDSTEEWIRCGSSGATTRSIKGAIRSTITGVSVTWILEHHLSTFEVRSIASSTGKRTIRWLSDVERRSCLECSYTTDLPATKDLTCKAFLVFVKWQFVDVAQHVPVTNILIAVSTIRARIVEASVGSQTGRVVDTVTPGVSVLEIEPISEPMGNCCLKAVVAGVC